MSKPESSPKTETESDKYNVDHQTSSIPVDKETIDSSSSVTVQGIRLIAIMLYKYFNDALYTVLIIFLVDFSWRVALWPWTRR
jgi:hypothetical protein